MRVSPLWKNAVDWFGKYGYFIYGDAGYPLRSWLLTGFRNLNKCSGDELMFNQHGSRGRVIVECAYGKLKGQWRCLMGGIRVRSYSDWKYTIMACCILHNVTIKIDGCGWSRYDDFAQRAPRCKDPAAFATEPTHVHPHHSQTGRSSRAAKAWRLRIFEKLKKIW